MTGKGARKPDPIDPEVLEFSTTERITRPSADRHRVSIRRVDLNRWIEAIKALGNPSTSEMTWAAAAAGAGVSSIVALVTMAAAVSRMPFRAVLILVSITVVAAFATVIGVAFGRRNAKRRPQEAARIINDITTTIASGPDTSGREEPHDQGEISQAPTR